MEDLELLHQARKALSFSYSPYSKFKVGAALLSKDGTVFCGTNVENASFGGTICAERSALVAAVSRGVTSFDKLAVCVAGERFASPCGICRQALAEFGLDLSIVCSAVERLAHGEFAVHSLASLLPQAFTDF